MPAHRLTTDAVGIASSHGQAVTNPPPVMLSAVIVSSAAAASFGTPPRPATRSSSVWPLCAGPTDQVLLRVSSTRAGCRPRSPAVPLDQPKLSTRMWVATDERKHTSPPASAANVKFGTTSPARKLTVDATGTLPPHV